MTNPYLGVSLEDEKRKKFQEIQTPTSQAPQSGPGLGSIIAQTAATRVADKAVDKGISYLGDAGASSLQGMGMNAMEAIGPAGNSLTSGVLNGATGLTQTGVGSQAAMLAEQGFLPETLGALQSGAAGATGATATGAATAATGATATGATGAAATGAMTAGAMFPPLLIGGLILHSMFK